MSLFHSHCKEYDKSVSWGTVYCSLECEHAEEQRQSDLIWSKIELERIKFGNI